jgi:hypothetical protein
MKYYIIEINYIGPNPLCDVDTIGIYKTPAYGNMDKQPVIDGWAGTTNDWATYAHGEFATLEDARAKVEEIYPDRREVELQDEDCVELWKPGKYAEMSKEGTSDWLASDLRLTGDETDEQLQEIIEVAESNANDNGCTLHHSAFDILVEERKWRKQEAL